MLCPTQPGPTGVIDAVKERLLAHSMTCRQLAEATGYSPASVHTALFYVRLEGRLHSRSSLPVGARGEKRGRPPTIYWLTDRRPQLG